MSSEDYQEEMTRRYKRDPGALQQAIWETQRDIINDKILLLEFREKVVRKKKNIIARTQTLVILNELKRHHPAECFEEESP